MADRAGFEPAVRLLSVRAFSKRLVSATHPPVRRRRIASASWDLAMVQSFLASRVSGPCAWSCLDFASLSTNGGAVRLLRTAANCEHFAFAKGSSRQTLDFHLKPQYGRRSSCAPVAQLDRVLDYESSGRWFESIRVRQFFSRKDRRNCANLQLDLRIFLFSRRPGAIKSWSIRPR